MNIAFLGSPEPAVPILERIIADGHNVITVVTPPDRKRGRGGALIPTPVGSAAQRHGLSVVHRLADCDFTAVDIAVVVAYGRIIPSHLLAIVPMLNVHFSLLPRWRGAAPVERAILAGDEFTGVCVMGIEPELDTGPVYVRLSTPVGSKSSAELLAELSVLGAEAMSHVLLTFGTVTPEAQAGEPTYAEKLTGDDFVIHPGMDAVQSERVIRLGRTRVQVGATTLKILRASVSSEPLDAGQVSLGETLRLGCGTQSLVVEVVQPDGGRPMDAREWLRGQRSHDSMTWSPQGRP